MVLSVKQLPLPFTYQALSAGEYSTCLNPPNYTLRGQPYCFRILGKIARGLARLIYQIAVTVLCAPLGIIYHSVAALVYKLKYCLLGKDVDERGIISEIALQHLKSAASDLFGVLTVLEIPFWLLPTQSTALFAPRCLVRVDLDLEEERYIRMPEMAALGELSPCWGWHAYGIASQGRFSYHILALVAATAREQGIVEGAARRVPTRQELRFQDVRMIARAILYLSRFSNLECPTPPTPSWFLDIELSKLLSFKKIEINPRYPFPWRSIAYGVAAVALIALAAVGCYACMLLFPLLATSIPAVFGLLAIPGFEALIVYSAYVASSRAKRAYESCYNEADLKFAEEVLKTQKEEAIALPMSAGTKQEEEESLKRELKAAAFFLKARDRGSPVAQHVYGQTVLKRAVQAIEKSETDYAEEHAILTKKKENTRGESREDITRAMEQLSEQRMTNLGMWMHHALEGLEWLYISAQKGNADALQDLNVLFKETQQFYFHQEDPDFTLTSRATIVNIHSKFVNAQFREKIMKLPVNSLIKGWKKENFINTLRSEHALMESTELDKEIEKATGLPLAVCSIITDYDTLNRKDAVERNKQAQISLESSP